MVQMQNETIPHHDQTNPDIRLLFDRMAAIENTLAELHAMVANPEPQRDWYTVAEVAQKLSRADFTVREWARLGRIYASKRACGRGPTQEWIISAEEVERIRNEGLLPN